MGEDELTDRLQDCGVTVQAQQEIIDCAKAGRTEKELRLLGRQRAGLLDALHQAQRRIDLMDLLIQSLKQNDTAK